MAMLARLRLNRAEHFLDLAEQHVADRERFTTYFETFVVYGRSVLHVLKNEVDAAGVFGCFEPEWDALGIDSLAKFFRGTRNTVLKEGVEGGRKRAEYTEIITVGLYVSDTAIVEVTRADGSVETQVVPPAPASEAQTKSTDTAEGSASYFLNEGAFEDQEVFSVSHAYLARLARAIQVAENCGA